MLQEPKSKRVRRASTTTTTKKKEGGRENSRLHVGDVSLHLVDVDLSDGFLSGRLVHVDVHDVLGDGLVETKKGEGRDASESSK